MDLIDVFLCSIAEKYIERNSKAKGKGTELNITELPWQRFLTQPFPFI